LNTGAYETIGSLAQMNPPQNKKTN